MKKEEIKKALEFCAQDNYYFCGGCSYDDVRNCNNKLKTDALNVIIEQEREIERLKAESANLIVENEVLQSEKENLMRKVEEGAEEIESARKETAKEILTELKNTRFHKGKLTYDFEMAVNRIAKQYGVEVEECTSIRD